MNTKDKITKLKEGLEHSIGASYEERLKEFIDKSDKEVVADYYKELKEQSTVARKNAQTVIRYMLILALLYFVVRHTKLTSFPFGPVTVNDNSIIIKIIALVFPYLQIVLFIDMKFGTDLNKALQILSHRLYNQPIETISRNVYHSAPLIRLISPINFFNELKEIFGRKDNKGKLLNGVTLPVFFTVTLLPFYFDYKLLKQIYINYFDWLGKCVFFVSIYMILYIFFIGFFLFVRSIVFQHKDKIIKRLDTFHSKNET